MKYYIDILGKRYYTDSKHIDVSSLVSSFPRIRETTLNTKYELSKNPRKN